MSKAGDGLAGKSGGGVGVGERLGALEGAVAAAVVAAAAAETDTSQQKQRPYRTLPPRAGKSSRDLWGDAKKSGHGEARKTQGDLLLQQRARAFSGSSSRR